MYQVLKIDGDTRLWLVTPNGVRRIQNTTILKGLRAKKLASPTEVTVSVDEFKVLTGVAP